MQIIPIINAKDATELDSRIKIIKEIYAGYPQDDPWVQIDVADGSFTNGYDNWRSPEELSQRKEVSQFKIEVDALVLDPADELERWISSNIKRFIFYLETTSDPARLIESCLAYSIEPVLALTPETSFNDAKKHLQSVKNCQLLAVTPGKSGQEFNPVTIDKIKEIRSVFPKICIQIDGGLTCATGEQAVEAGANRLAASSFIFNNPNPIRAYADLRDLYFGQD